MTFSWKNTMYSLGTIQSLGVPDVIKHSLPTELIPLPDRSSE